MRIHDQKTIDNRITRARSSRGPFVIHYWTSEGLRTVYGKEMDRPFHGSISFMEFGDGIFQHSGLIYISDLTALWTEDDDCPNCGEFLVDLDGFGNGDDLPLCQVCAREAWETARAEGVIADGEALRAEGGYLHGSHDHGDADEGAIA